MAAEEVITSGASLGDIPSALVALAPGLISRIGQNLTPLIEMKTILIQRQHHV